ncbi:MAG: glycosyltransferase family 39 protein [Syntrophales bacterium]|jgi:hypothetical protein|nr:glycosyltransferase family 39 protein [Syntrophales bacterium]
MNLKLSPEKKILIVLLCLSGVVLFFNVGHYYLWGDEGVTAFYGKSVMKFGLPYGFDGTNLHQTKNGLFLNGNLLPHLDGWLQYYAAALSMTLFGTDTFGARALFVAAGLLSILLQYIFVVRFFRDEQLALINVLLLTTSVTFLLFTRQCRYYSLVMLLAPAVGCLYSLDRRGWVPYIGACLLFLLLFFSQYIIAFAILTAFLVVFALFDDRDRAFRFFLRPLPVVIGVAGLFLFWLYHPGAPHHPNMLKNLHPADFGRIFWLYVKDFNGTQLLPVGVVPFLIWSWIREKRSPESAGLSRRGVPAVLLLVLLFTLILSVLSPQSSDARYSDIRYACAVFPFLLLLQALAVRPLWDWHKGLATLMLVVMIFTNFLTFTTPRSFLADYVAENVRNHDNSVKAAVQFLEKRIRPGEFLLVSPNHMIGSMEFYLGDRMRFCNVIGPDSPILHSRQMRIPEYVYSEDTLPDWVVLFGWETDQEHTKRHLEKLLSKDYRAYRLPVFGPDVSRPELFWRSFSPVTGYPDALGLTILERAR